MTIEEIRKNAPAGATHYIDDIDGLSYFKFQSFEWVYYDSGNWLRSGIGEYEERVLLKLL